MIKYKPGDFIVAGNLGDVNVYVNKPGPSITDRVSTMVWRFDSRSIGMIVSIVDDDHLFVTVDGYSGFVLSRTVVPFGK